MIKITIFILSICLFIPETSLAGGEIFEPGTAIEEAKKLSPPKSKIKKIIFNEFIRYSEIELKEKDLSDSDKFATMAIDLVKNKKIKLSDPLLYNISDSDRIKFESGRKRLQNAISKYSKSDPEMVAKSVTLYECALLEAEEYPRNCERGFFLILEKLESKEK